MPWVHLDELYSWFTQDPEDFEPYQVNSDSYLQVSQVLWDRLKAAEDALDAVHDEIGEIAQLYGE